MRNLTLIQLTDDYAETQYFKHTFNVRWVLDLLNVASANLVSKNIIEIVL